MSWGGCYYWSPCLQQKKGCPWETWTWQFWLLFPRIQIDTTHCRRCFLNQLLQSLLRWNRSPECLSVARNPLCLHPCKNDRNLTFWCQVDDDNVSTPRWRSLLAKGSFSGKFQWFFTILKHLSQSWKASNWPYRVQMPHNYHPSSPWKLRDLYRILRPSSLLLKPWRLRE